MSSKLSEENEIDDFMQSNEDTDGSLNENGNIVNVLKTMNIVSEEERESIRKNLEDSIPYGSDGEYVESDWEYYGFMMLNILVFLSFGKTIVTLLLCKFCFRILLITSGSIFNNRLCTEYKNKNVFD